jgi:hypothetical protein
MQPLPTRSVEKLDRPVHEILEAEGPEQLLELPGIGRSLARGLTQLCRTGRLPILERLRGDALGESVLATVSSIGPELAARIHDQLGIETLADLEAAAHDGTLTQVPGMGRKRVQAVRESLAGRFRQHRVVASRTRESEASSTPPVAELLDIDEQYRRLSGADRLIRIAPRRFNPERKAWLPILHTHRGDRHYTALFSNTARAHELGMTGDWVVIYRDDAGADGQWTVITSRLGPLKGQRIVRGREHECGDYYQARSGHFKSKAPS